MGYSREKICPPKSCFERTICHLHEFTNLIYDHRAISCSLVIREHKVQMSVRLSDSQTEVYTVFLILSTRILAWSPETGHNRLLNPCLLTFIDRIKVIKTLDTERATLNNTGINIMDPSILQGLTNDKSRAGNGPRKIQSAPRQFQIPVLLTIHLL